LTHEIGARARNAPGTEAAPESLLVIQIVM
jgi:hypothetical protein